MGPFIKNTIMVTIYTLSSTRNVDNVRYVGKTIQKLQARLRAHINAAKRAKKLNYTSNYNWNWINKELDEGFEIKIEYLDELDVDNNGDWEWLESYWIAQFKAWGFNLTNLTSGGDGNKNQVFTAESRKKRSESLKGRKRSKEECEAISKGRTGIKLTELHKQHVREGIVKIQGKQIIQYDLLGNFIKTWDYIEQAAKYFKVDSSNIIKCCNKHPKHKTCRGYVWRYVFNPDF